MEMQNRSAKKQQEHQEQDQDQDQEQEQQEQRENQDQRDYNSKVYLQVYIKKLHDENTLYFIYTVRAFFLLFITSWCVEVMRLYADDRADYLTAYHNPPAGCFPVPEKEWKWDWSMVYTPVTTVYNNFFEFFEAPIKTNCNEYFRRINPILLYLPRFPQALANVATSFFLTPFVLFMDKFGDSVRHFMDKFNFMERIAGVTLLIVFLLLSMLLFGFMVWSQPRYVERPVLIEDKKITNGNKKIVNGNKKNSNMIEDKNKK